MEPEDLQSYGLIPELVGRLPVVAALMPVALALVHRADGEAGEKRRLTCTLLLALAYSAAVGSAGTPSGSARNAIMLEYWRTICHYNIDYLDWILTAYPFVLITVPVVQPAARGTRTVMARVATAKYQ